MAKDFLEKIQDKKEYFNMVNEYPNNENIKDLFQEMKDWQFFKKKALENIQFNKHNKNAINMSRFFLF